MSQIPVILDGVPSVTKQGYRVALMKSAAGGYNAGMTKKDGQLLLCTRTVEFVESFQNPGHKQLQFKLVWQKPNGAGDGFNLDLVGSLEIPGFDPEGHAEDPRIFNGPHGSRWLSFGHSTDDVKRPPCVRLAKLSDDLKTAELMPTCNFGNNGMTGNPQKNWQFFFQGDSLFCVYWTYPHRVFALDPYTGKVLNEWNAQDDKNFVWQWGPLAGGTPPIPWRGKMLSFFHGSMWHPTRRRRYFMGAYTFEAEAPFRITAITAPMLRGSMNDPTNFEPPNHAGLPLVVFPCGCLIEEGDPDACIVSMGVNDSYSAIASFDLRQLPWQSPEDLRHAKTFHFFTPDATVPPRATQNRNLAWTLIKDGAGGILATDNPVAIEDCLTRGTVVEIAKDMFDALSMTAEQTPASLVADDTVTGVLSVEVFEKIARGVPRLPGWSTVETNLEFAAVIMATRPQIGVEVGVFGGRTLVSIALAMKAVGVGVIHGIDPWSAKASIEGEVVKANIDWWGELDHETVFKSACSAVDAFGVQAQVKIHRMKSDEFEPPNDIGILIIDGNHCAQAITDVKRFAPKVRLGGFCFMDDISWSGGYVLEGTRLLESDYGFKMLYRRGEGAMFQRIRYV